MPELNETVRRLSRRWWVLAVALLAGLALGALYAAFAPPRYVASAFVAVRGADPEGGTQAAVAFAQAYGRIVTSPQVLTAAAESSLIPVTKLLDDVSAATSPDAPLIQLTAVTGTPIVAASEANAVADSFVGEANKHVQETGVRLTVLSRAIPPPTRTSPTWTVSLAVGAVAGILIGGLAAASEIGSEIGSESRSRTRSHPGGSSTDPEVGSGVLPLPARGAPDSARAAGHEEPVPDEDLQADRT